MKKISIILFLLIISPSALAFFEGSDCECGVDSPLVKSTGTGSLLSCDYYGEKIEDYYMPKITFETWYHPDKRRIESTIETLGERHEEKIEYKYTIDAYESSEDRVLLVYHSKTSKHNFREGVLSFQTGDFNTNIRVVNYGDTATEQVKKIEKCIVKAVAAHAVRQAERKSDESEPETPVGKIKVEHEHPFPYLIEDAWFSSSDSMVGGELRATVLDEDGDGDKGKLVVFYVEKDDALYDVVSDDHFVRFPGSTTTWRELESKIDNVGLLSYVGYGVTDKNGVAKTSYLFGDRLNMQKLSAQIVLGEGIVEGKVHAAVIDLDKKEVELSSSVDLKFDHIAQIVSISGEGVADVLPVGDMQGVVSGPGQVRVKRILVEPLKYDEVKVGYELMPGDIINADADTRLEVMWVNGDRVIAKLPKYVSVAEKVVYPSASIVLLADAYSSGFPSTLGKGGDIAYGMAVEKGWSFLVDTIKSEIPGSGLVGNGYDFIVGISEKFKEYDAVDLSKFSIISRIRVKSQFLVDATGDDVKISVLEGNPDVVSSGGEVSLVEGESVVFDSGEMGNVEKSDKDDFEGWDIPEVRVSGAEDSGGFSFGWVFFFGLVVFVLWLVGSARKENGFKDKLSRMLEGK